MVRDQGFVPIKGETFGTGLRSDLMIDTVWLDVSRWARDTWKNCHIDITRTNNFRV